MDEAQVTRVAKAIWDNRISHFPDNPHLIASDEISPDSEPWLWTLGDARAAIAAMAEPATIHPREETTMKPNGDYENGDPVSLRTATVSETGVQIPFGAGGKFLDWIEVPNRALVAFDVDGYPDPVETAVDTARLEFTGEQPEPQDADDIAVKPGTEEERV